MQDFTSTEKKALVMNNQQYVTDPSKMQTFIIRRAQMKLIKTYV